MKEIINKNIHEEAEYLTTHKRENGFRWAVHGGSN